MFKGWLCVQGDCVFKGWFCVQRVIVCSKGDCVFKGACVFKGWLCVQRVSQADCTTDCSRHVSEVVQVDCIKLIKWTSDTAKVWLWDWHKTDPLTLTKAVREPWLTKSQVFSDTKWTCEADGSWQAAPADIWGCNKWLPCFKHSLMAKFAHSKQCTGKALS